MKLRLDQLKSHLAKGPENSSVYMVSGDEPLVVQEACDLIRQAFNKSGFSEREIHHADKGFNWDEVLFSANSLSLFAEKKLIEIRMSGNPGEAGAKALNEFLEAPSDETAIMVVTGKIDANAQKRKWFLGLEKQIIWIQIWPVERKDLPGWVGNRLKSAGLSADKDVIGLLCDRTEGNLLAAAQEIERLKLVAPEGQLTIDKMMDDVADSTRYDVFKLIDTALSGNSVRTVKMLRGLQSQGVDSLALLGLVARELRALGTMSAKVSKGQSVDAVMKSNRVWFNRKNVVGKALRSHSCGEFISLLERLTLIDQMVKGQKSGNAWDELADIFLSVSGQSPNLA